MQQIRTNTVAAVAAAICIAGALPVAAHAQSCPARRQAARQVGPLERAEPQQGAEMITWVTGGKLLPKEIANKSSRTFLASHFASYPHHLTRAFYLEQIPVDFTHSLHA
jgi:hypothetical protein